SPRASSSAPTADREPEAGARSRALAPEAVERMELLFVGEPRPVVPDADLAVPPRRSGRHLDLAPRADRLERVRKEVVEHLLDPVAARAHDRRRGRAGPEPEAALFGEGSPGVHPV